MPGCTIVIPCYNEADRLDLATLIRYGTSHDQRLLFVNDGSCDATGEILDDLVSALPDCFAVRHLPKNQGKAEAVRAGLLTAVQDAPSYIGYWDADLATPLEVIDEFVDYLDTYSGVDILLGARVRLLGRAIERRAARHCLGRIFATAAAATLRLPVYDTQCGAKLLRNTGLIREILAEPFLTKWLFDVELMARYLAAETVDMQGGEESPIHELPLPRWRDVPGSKVKLFDFVRAIWQLAVIHRSYRRGIGMRRWSNPAVSGADGGRESIAAPPRSQQPVLEQEPVAHVGENRL